MSSYSRQLHVAVFPFMSQSHMMAAIDVAKLFASRGQKVTLISTPSNAPMFAKSTQKSREKGHQITLQVINFPSSEIRLPQGCETRNFVYAPESRERFLRAISLLEKPIDEFIREQNPDVLAADTHFSWANNVAAKHGIPRLIFHGTCNFAICASLCIKSYEPHEKVLSDSEHFVVPHLPGEIEFTRDQLPSFMKLDYEETEYSKVFKASADSDSGCYGVIVNSFYELEPDYTDFYRNFLKRKTWNIGPVSLCNNDSEEKENRGNRSSTSTIDHECLKWLEHKEPNSVIYICFGSTTMFTDEQLMQMALGLEASRVKFIWVVNKNKEENRHGVWLLKGFETRMKEKGLIIKNWAPYLLILGHRAVGAFVTHCGWNSVMEGVVAGVAMVTWPVGGEQFFNEKVVTQVLKIRVGVGVRRWVRLVGDSVKKEAIEGAVRRVMVGEEAEEMRSRARVLAKKAREAVEDEGSSHRDLSSLIGELVHATMMPNRPELNSWQSCGIVVSKSYSLKEPHF